MALWCFQNVIAALALHEFVEVDSVFARIKRKWMKTVALEIRRYLKAN